MDIILIQKIALALALAGTLLVILRKAMAYEREEREELWPRARRKTEVPHGPM
jgi:hypothetical protein